MDKASNTKSGRGGFVFGAASTVLAVLFSVVLTVLYLIGDVNPLGETFTIWPPLLWVFLLAVICSITIFAKSWRWSAVAIVSVALFVVISEDWRSLLRGRLPLTEKQGIRLISWNVAGRSDVAQMLTELATIQPDIVFMQESPGGKETFSSTTLAGRWKGFEWYDGGDCGILSRYELQPVRSESIGPWDIPALATTTVPATDGSTKSLLLCNVRMMLPLITTDVSGWFEDKEKRVRAHRQRVVQYENLTKLIQDSDQHDGVILGGDFNVRGNSTSLRPLAKAGLTDVWKSAGRGWGGTVLADFPLARIDQVWMSNTLEPRSGQIVRGSVSDHRMVVVDFIVP